MRTSIIGYMVWKTFPQITANAGQASRKIIQMALCALVILAVQKAKDNMSKHTLKRLKTDGMIILDFDGEKPIAYTIKGNISIEECKENACHIVHCVNLHDELVEALKISVNAHCPTCLLTFIESEQIKQAIKQAESEG